MKAEKANALLLESYAREVQARYFAFDQTAEILDAIHFSAEWLTDTSRRPWLIMSGGVGTGKTSMIRAIAGLFEYARSKYIEQAEELNKRDPGTWKGSEYAQLHEKARKYYCRIATANDLTKCAANEEAVGEYEKALASPILAVDDLGTEPISIKVFGNEILPLVDLLSARYDQMLPTIITTNLGPEKITERYGERIADRIREMAEVIQFSGPSFRGL